MRIMYVPSIKVWPLLLNKCLEHFQSFPSRQFTTVYYGKSGEQHMLVYGNSMDHSKPVQNAELWIAVRFSLVK